MPILLVAYFESLLLKSNAFRTYLLVVINCVLNIPGNTLFASAGCCFIKYATAEEADRAIRALHNQYTLPGVSIFCIFFIFTRIHIVLELDDICWDAWREQLYFLQGMGPIQVRYADGERERLGNVLYQYFQQVESYVAVFLSSCCNLTSVLVLWQQNIKSHTLLVVFWLKMYPDVVFFRVRCSGIQVVCWIIK